MSAICLGFHRKLKLAKVLSAPRETTSAVLKLDTLEIGVHCVPVPTMYSTTTGSSSRAQFLKLFFSMSTLIWMLSASA